MLLRISYNLCLPNLCIANPNYSSEFQKYTYASLFGPSTWMFNKNLKISMSKREFPIVPLQNRHAYISPSEIMTILSCQIKWLGLFLICLHSSLSSLACAVISLFKIFLVSKHFSATPPLPPCLNAQQSFIWVTVRVSLTCLCSPLSRQQSVSLEDSLSHVSSLHRIP